jgi:glycosyltransferase involved in cell wall biosynthesis
MRVAMLGPYPRDEGASVAARIVGGPEAVVVCLLKHLARLPDLELHVITCRPGSARRTFSQSVSGIAWVVHELPRYHLGRLTWHGRERREVVACLRTLSPDIVHAHTSGLYAAAALDAGFPAVITVHGIGFREAQIAPGWRARLRGMLDSAFERRTLRRAQHLIAISPYVEREFAGITQSQSYAIENPVEDLYFSVRAQPELGRILFAGRLIPRKGVQDLLAAFRLIAPEYPAAMLALAGEENKADPYTSALHRYVQEQGLQERVLFLGSLDMAQMAAEYGRCAFLVLPSKQETAPVVIEEAMAAGRPVIATPVGGVPDQVAHEHTGLLVEYGDALGLMAAMRRLLSDANLRTRLGQAAREEALRRFRGDVVARQTQALYQYLVGSAHGQAS